MYTTISETVNAYNDMLNECYPDLNIAGLTYDTDELEDDYTFTRDRM